MGRTLTVVAIAAVALLAAAPGADAARRRVPHGFYGTIWAGEIESAPSDVRARAWDALAKGGVESVRALFSWRLTQPKRDGPYDWTRSDRVVEAAAVRDIDVMPTLDVPPDWAAEYPGTPGSAPADGYGFAAFARFAAAAVGRYGPHGSFWSEHPELPRRPLRAWQVWNEPEIPDGWARDHRHWESSDAARYGELLRQAYAAIHQADPGANVVLSGLTNFAWEDLAMLYRDGGARGHFDIAALHMFPGDWRSIAVIVRRFRHVLDAHGAKRMPLWVTEMTWPAAKGRTQVPQFANTPYYRNFITTDHGSAKRLAGAYKLLGERRFRKQNRIARVNWYLATSSYQGNVIWSYSGLMQWSDGQLGFKPSYRAYRTVARRDEGCMKTAAGACR